jgi:hypothetical protein
MALEDCSECKNKVSSTAYECPCCGAVFRKRPRFGIGDLVAGILIAGIIAGIILALFRL